MWRVLSEWRRQPPMEERGEKKKRKKEKKRKREKERKREVEGLIYQRLCLFLLSLLHIQTKLAQSHGVKAAIDTVLFLLNK